ncbi:hypothetical protein ACHAXT_004566 [Thalassiosira profunda]
MSTSETSPPCTAHHADEGNIENTPRKKKWYLLMANPSKTTHLGTLLRCAAAFGAHQVLVVGHDKFNCQGSFGAHLFLDILAFPTWESVGDYLRNGGDDGNGIQDVETSNPITTIGILGAYGGGEEVYAADGVDVYENGGYVSLVRPKCIADDGIAKQSAAIGSPQRSFPVSAHHDSGGLRATGTKPTHVPKSVVEALRKFNPRDFETKSLQPPQGTSVILFYNLFIPDNAAGAAHAIRVIREQLGQVGASLGEMPKSRKSATLFYNVIGNARAFPEKKMKELCRQLPGGSQLSCHHMASYDTASESVTLQDIYDFCQNDDYADLRVTYIHSKGSYHQTEVNDNWRRALTDSVVHPDCLFPPNDRCNVCGAQFYTRFSTMYPGNMWTAKCSYVKRLLPPLEGGEYDVRKKESIIKFLKYRLWGQLNSTLMDDRVDYFGLGRYRLEHWIGSHPSIQPCELHRKNVTFASMIEGDITPADYEWGMGPRRREVVGEDLEARARIQNDEDAQFREYFFLPGNLLKWFTLYGSDGIPSKKSWVWKFFPAGAKWKKLVDRYGENAVEQMVMQSSRGIQSAFSVNEDERLDFQIEPQDEKRFTGDTPPLVVFYNVVIPEDKTKKVLALRALKAQIDVLALGQYDIISRAYHRQRHVVLYYTVSGDSSNIGFFTKLCQARSQHITCRKLGEFASSTATGEALHHLHTFCHSQPTGSVTYLSNMLPGTHGVNRTESFSTQKIRTFTTAVTSKMCLKSRDTCNVCGTEFYPLPFHHFLGNMFTASCEYVKELLPPEQFEKATNDAAGETLVSQLRRAVTTDLFPFTPQNLGLGQYSVEHWIGSHPDLRPCDVAPVRHSWFPFFTGSPYLANDFTSSRAYDFMWSEAPRRSSAPPGQLSRTIEHRAIAKDATAYREYYYLAGNLLRWHNLYDKAPPWDSWIWKWYPRGDEWRDSAKKHGSNVVTKAGGNYTAKEQRIRKDWLASDALGGTLIYDRKQPVSDASTASSPYYYVPAQHASIPPTSRKSPDGKSEENIQWTPQDSSYGAAVPAFGWIPKHARKILEGVLVVLIMTMLIFVVVKVGIALKSSGSGEGEDTYFADDDHYIAFNDDGAGSSGSESNDSSQD